MEIWNTGKYYFIANTSNKYSIRRKSCIIWRLSSKITLDPSTMMTNWVMPAINNPDSIYFLKIEKLAWWKFIMKTAEKSNSWELKILWFLSKISNLTRKQTTCIKISPYTLFQLTAGTSALKKSSYHS